VELLIFLLKKRFKSFYSINNWKRMLSVFVFSAILIIYAIGAGYLYDMYIGRHLVASALTIIMSIKIMLIVLPVTLKFFPSISLKQTIISPHFPLTTLKIALIDFFSICFVKITNWILFAFVLVFSLTSNNIHTQEAISLFYYWIIGFLLAENIINAVTWRKYFYLTFTVSLFALLILFIKYQPQFHIALNYLFITLTACTALLFASFFLFYKGKSEVQHVSGYKAAKGQEIVLSKFLTFKILWNNQRFRSALLIAIGCKVSFLVLFLSSTERYSFSEILHKVPFILLLEPPVIIFTYIFNNVWGYFIDVELNNIIANPSLKAQLKTYLSFFLPVLLIDAVVVLIVFGYFNVLTFKLLLIYIVISIYCLSLGFLSSFRKYFLVDLSLNFSRFRGKTSQFYSFLMIAPAFIVGFLYDLNIYLYIFLLGMLIASVFISLYIRSTFGTHFKKLKATIFNLKPVSSS
jgi:hypothetical protein